LCASIYDERMAASVPSASGSGGTGSWRFFAPRGRHQDIEDLASSQPHRFTPRLKRFASRDERLPVGSHTAKALIAPRPLLNTQGAHDGLANPVGTRKTFEAAQRLFGNQGIVDLAGLIGHYTLVNYTLKAFDVQRPPGTRLLLPLTDQP
jgi:hypothetical protein